MRGWQPGPTRGSTARTTRASRTGPGRTAADLVTVATSGDLRGPKVARSGNRRGRTGRIDARGGHQDGGGRGLAGAKGGRALQRGARPAAPLGPRARPPGV